MLKSKLILKLLLINLIFNRSTCFSKVTEMEKGNSGNYFSISAVAGLNSVRENKKFEPTLAKISYRYSWIRNSFIIGPKIFTLINISNDSENFRLFDKKQPIESSILKDNKVGLGLSVGFDLSDNITLIGTVSGIKRFNDFHRQMYSIILVMT